MLHLVLLYQLEFLRHNKVADGLPFSDNVKESVSITDLFPQQNILHYFLYANP